jgi:sortase A
VLPWSADRLRRALLWALVLLGAQQLGSAGLIYGKAALAPVLVERAWTATLARGGLAHKPWPWADTWPVARLTVAQLDVDLFVLAGAGGHALAFGPGLDAAGAAPGEAGTAIIAGHRDTHFRFLRDLQPAMRLQLQLADGRRLRYRVLDTAVVDSRQAPAPPDAGPAGLVLVTCFPFETLVAGGPLRYVVRAVAAPLPRPEARFAHYRSLEVIEL